jgi:prepilin-type N-terminal cleavage/methylation domain-containing protein
VRRDTELARGFTLLELLTVVGVVAILAALLLPALSAAQGRARRSACSSNLRQINLSVHLYADDHNGLLPMVKDSGPPQVWSDYELFIRSYVGLKGNPSPGDRLFACPADTFYYDYNDYVAQSLHRQPNFRFASYAFNAGNSFAGVGQPRWPGIAGRKVASIRLMEKTVLVAEFAALPPFSWHQPVPGGHVSDARNLVSFVEGHVSYLKMYWDAVNVTNGHREACQYDPPAGYGYKWNGD